MKKPKKQIQPVDPSLVRVIGYARVSTEEQSLDMQVAALEKFGCHRIFHEKISARRAKRPQWELAKKVIRRGDQLVVWKLDRLSRDAIEMLETVNWLNSRGVELISLMEKLDTQTPIGKFAFGIMALMAQFESDTTSFRTEAGVRRAQERGVVFGRKPTIVGALAEKIDADLAAGLSLREIGKKYKKAPGTIAKYRDRMRKEIMAKKAKTKRKK